MQPRCPWCFPAAADALLLLLLLLLHASSATLSPLVLAFAFSSLYPRVSYSSNAQLQQQQQHPTAFVVTTVSSGLCRGKPIERQHMLTKNPRCAGLTASSRGAAATAADATAATAGPGALGEAAAAAGKATAAAWKATAAAALQTQPVTRVAVSRVAATTAAARGRTVRRRAAATTRRAPQAGTAAASNTGSAFACAAPSRAVASPHFMTSPAAAAAAIHPAAAFAAATRPAAAFFAALDIHEAGPPAAAMALHAVKGGGLSLVSQGLSKRLFRVDAALACASWPAEAACTSAVVAAAAPGTAAAAAKEAFTGGERRQGGEGGTAATTAEKKTFTKCGSNATIYSARVSSEQQRRFAASPEATAAAAYAFKDQAKGEEESLQLRVVGRNDDAAAAAAAPAAESSTADSSQEDAAPTCGVPVGSVSALGEYARRLGLRLWEEERAAAGSSSSSASPVAREHEVSRVRARQRWREQQQGEGVLHEQQQPPDAEANEKEEPQLLLRRREQRQQQAVTKKLLEAGKEEKEKGKQQLLLQQEPPRQRRLVILGSTGSVGRSTMQVVEAFPHRFAVVGLAAAGTNLPLLLQQIRRHRPQYVAVGDAATAAALERLLRNSPAGCSPIGAAVVAPAASPDSPAAAGRDAGGAHSSSPAAVRAEISAHCRAAAAAHSAASSPDANTAAASPLAAATAAAPLAATTTTTTTSASSLTAPASASLVTAHSAAASSPTSWGKGPALAVGPNAPSPPSSAAAAAAGASAAAFPSAAAGGSLPAAACSLPHIFYGDEGLLELASLDSYDVLVSAVVGFKGLQPTLRALTTGKDVALANKEALVAAGSLFRNLYAKTSSRRCSRQRLQKWGRTSSSRRSLSAAAGVSSFETTSANNSMQSASTSSSPSSLSSPSSSAYLSALYPLSAASLPQLQQYRQQRQHQHQQRRLGILLPVDSEHSAIFQALQGVAPTNYPPRRLLLTASGGPFRGRKRADLQQVTLDQVLKHPRWSMGPKISVDSATLMNKGLEVIEAHCAFGCPFTAIEVVVHPEAVVHSAVELCDGAVLAQMGTPDMKLPIAYALTWPERLTTTWPRLDLLKQSTLTFERPDLDTFGCLRLAYEAGTHGGLAPACLNAANEVAVGRLLKNQLSFLQIEELVRYVLQEYLRQEAQQPTSDDLTFQDLLEADSWARRVAQNWKQ